ncbi:hypothetical protein YC2023_075868 [Brassica napus]
MSASSVVNSEIHGSIPVRAARLGTSQAELKDGTTSAYCPAFVVPTCYGT